MLATFGIATNKNGLVPVFVFLKIFLLDVSSQRAGCRGIWRVPVPDIGSDWLIVWFGFFDWWSCWSKGSARASSSAGSSSCWIGLGPLRLLSLLSLLTFGAALGFLHLALALVTGTGRGCTWWVYINGGYFQRFPNQTVNNQSFSIMLLSDRYEFNERLLYFLLDPVRSSLKKNVSWHFKCKLRINQSLPKWIATIRNLS